ncbi:MAG: MogA/MoaB family molybdenum cofactor biosynthesis protein [Candidatus Nitrospinota bacterium M3_3B_026]
MSAPGKISTALLVASDRASRGEREDRVEKAMRSFLEKQGLTLGRFAVVPDDEEAIRETMREWADSGEVDLLLTAGGTGVSPRDVTPEATRPLLDRPIPGIPEAMRAASLAKSSNAVLSRGLAGLRGKVMIINLPGSPRAAVENIEAVFEAALHGISKAGGDESECAPSA